MVVVGSDFYFYLEGPIEARQKNNNKNGTLNESNSKISHWVRGNLISPGIRNQVTFFSFYWKSNKIEWLIGSLLITTMTIIILSINENDANENLGKKSMPCGPRRHYYYFLTVSRYFSNKQADDHQKMSFDDDDLCNCIFSFRSDFNYHDDHFS